MGEFVLRGVWLYRSEYFTVVVKDLSSGQLLQDTLVNCSSFEWAGDSQVRRWFCLPWARSSCWAPPGRGLLFEEQDLRSTGRP